MISEEITRLLTAKADIKAALEEKGVEVSSSAKLDSYAGLIEDMNVGGGFITTISEEDFDVSTFGTTMNISKLVKKLIIPNGITTINKDYSLTDVEYVEIPNTVTTLGNYIFNGCSKLSKIKFELNSPVTLIPYEFVRSCNNLQIENFPENITTISGGAFRNSHLKTFPSLSNNVAFDGERIFESCDFLLAKIPNAITALPNLTFINCKNLQSIDFSNVLTIGDSCCSGCDNLTNIVIPSSVTSIGAEAFSYTTPRVITVLATTPPTIGRNAFGYSVDFVNTIYVPAESVEAYKTASMWSNYASKIQAIPTE